jgi:hypothetical protein
MAKERRSERKRLAAPTRTAVYLDAHGSRTEDPGRVRAGEVVEHDEHGEPVRRTWLYVLETRWPWLNEPRFLLVTLGLLLTLWLLVAVLFLL